MNQYANEKLYPEEWTLDGLIEDAEKIYAPAGRLKKEELVELSRDELKETLEGLAEECYHQRELLFGEENMRELEKVVMLRVVDQKWKEHLDHMDMLREGINLRAYGQRNPLVEYKIEALDMFEEMEGSIMDQIASLMYHVSIVMPQPQAEEADEEAQERAAEAQKAQMQRTIEAERSKLTDSLREAQAAHGDDVSAAEVRKPVTNKDGSKVGRNDPCPCGSGKKYKNCCGKNA
jgi:preprotein translocase subunit SecA